MQSASVSEGSVEKVFRGPSVSEGTFLDALTPASVSEEAFGKVLQWASVSEGNLEKVSRRASVLEGTIKIVFRARSVSADGFLGPKNLASALVTSLKSEGCDEAELMAGSPRCSLACRPASHVVSPHRSLLKRKLRCRVFHG